MKKDVQLLVQKLKSEYRRKIIWKKIVGILSCIVFFLTIYFLATPAITYEQGEPYTFKLIDNYAYDWKDSSYITNYNLNLYFMDMDGNYIEGKDITFELSPNNLIDDPYGFGYVPYKDDTLTYERGKNLIEVLNINEIVATTGEKYEFDHAEVLVDGIWQKFSDEGKHWNIWCQSSSSSTKPTDYGWRGNYNESTKYIINNNTEYKFVYKKIRYGQSNSVESLGTDSGITFKMFNYSGNNSEIGINSNGVYEYFTFRGSDGNTVSKINATLDADGFINTTRVKVLSKLENGYPVFNCQGYEGCINFSLGYLFGSLTNPVGSTPVGVTVYNPTNTLLQKDTEGDYYYDSNINAVDYDTENNRFMLRNYVERSYSMTTYINEASRYEFMPFNYWNNYKKEGTNANNNRKYNYESVEIDHWFGMTMEFSFYMPKNGKLNGEDMIFSFSGDDDVWVFIDDVLVLDLGGTHGAVDGSINFATGEIESYLNWNDVKGTIEVGTANKTNIYKMFTNASSADSTYWNDANTTFENYTKHTLKFFYLERGAAVSNCKIRFNMPVLPSGTLSVQKQFEGIDTYNENYQFTLYDTTNGDSKPVTNAKYTVGNNEFYTDKNGSFTLKNDEIALFKLNNGHKYFVAETDTGDYSISYKCNLDGIDCPGINQTDEFTINPESTYIATFTNKIKSFDLNVSKIVNWSDETESFEFRVSLKDTNNLPVDITDDINLKYLVDHTNGIITFSLKSNEEITINDIPINTIVTLQEIEHNGYYTIIKTGDILLTNGDIYEFTMDSNKNITVYNISGVMLPETGGTGIWSYLVIGISLIIISIKFGYKYLFKMKEGEK